MLEFNQKVVLVTGASRGLGREIALTFAMCGAALVVNFHKREEDAQSLVSHVLEFTEASEAIPFQADVAAENDVLKLFEFIARHFGRLDVVVNNAGTVHKKSISDMSEREWKATLDVHLTGTFLCCREAIRLMKQQEAGGSIINISGSFGVTGEAGFAHVSAAKAGVVGLTRSLAREVGNCGIRVNAVAPSMIDIGGTRRLPRDYVKKIVRRYPIARLGRPEEVAAVVRFLASREAGFITGQTICPTGGDVMI